MVAETGAPVDTVDQVLFCLLRYEEVLGALASSQEGLVIGNAGMSREDSDAVGALGASLVGVAERTARRIDADAVRDVDIATADGMNLVRVSDGGFAAVTFSERRDTLALGRAADEAIREIGRLLAGG